MFAVFIASFGGTGQQGEAVYCEQTALHKVDVATYRATETGAEQTTEKIRETERER